MDELDLSAFQHGGMNITGFRLVDPERPEVFAVQKNWSSLNPISWKGAGNDKKIEVNCLHKYETPKQNVDVN